MSTADRLIEDPLIKAYMVGIMRGAGDRPRRRRRRRHRSRGAHRRSVLGKFKTSTLQDLEAGKPLEVDGLLAGTLEIAEKAGVQAPLTQSLFGLIRTRAQSTGQYKKTA